MRERLIELCENLILSCKSSLCADCEHNNIDYPHCMGVHFADYLLANGVIVPPCKVGDRVWAIRDYKGVKHPQEGVVSEMFFTNDMELMIVVKFVARGVWGKTVFLTREEAEQALKGGAE